MKRFWLFLLLPVFFGSVLFAQVPINKHLTLEHNEAQNVQQKPFPIHITDKLIASEEGKAALNNFHTLREKGLLPAFKTQTAMAAVGDTLAFKVLNIEKSSYETLKFRLEYTNTKANLWVSLNALKDNVVTATEIEALRVSLFDSTPVDSKKGVIDTDISVFGNAPNTDGDGKIDFLWYDIIDGYDGITNFGWIEGFFSPNDLVGGGSGNNKDMLHLDVYPTLKLGVAEVAQTVAHELQHLIHANYDVGEDLFVNEGLSEWAEVYMGYRGRSISYFNSESNTAFMQFRAKTDNVYNDYQRGGLFTTYLANQLGATNVGTITQDKKRGFVGYEAFMQKYASEITISDLMLNFHTANYLNNTTLNKAFGYTSPQRVNIKAKPYVSVDGALSTSVPTTTMPQLQSGGMYYLQWKGVKDFAFTVDAVATANNTITELRNMVKIRAITIDKAGVVTTTDYAPSASKITLTGDFSEVMLIVAHIQPNPAKAIWVDWKYSASWANNAGANVTVETVKYSTSDTIAVDNTGEAFFVPIGTATGKQATRFIKPKNAVRLHKFMIANYYLSQFAGTGQDQTASRDFRLSVWKNNAAKTLPGDEIFGVDLKDNRGYTGATATMSYQEIDLSNYADKLSSLPDTVYVGISETGTDTNYMVLAPIAYDKENVSFIFGSTRWVPLWGITFSDGTGLSNTAFGMQAQFLVQKIVANEDIAELPKKATLSQNYPNPFNPTTTIQYTIPQASLVKLTVYDLLGRQVEALVSQHQVAGEYSVVWEAKHFASGTYFYTLEVGNTRLTQRMTLVK